MVDIFAAALFENLHNRGDRAPAANRPCRIFRMFRLKRRKLAARRSAADVATEAA